jgi:hypothetical protein
MEKTKTVLDREPLNSEYINSRQDFSKVVSGYKALKPPFWKSAWFYGTAGLATIAIVTSVVLYNPDTDNMSSIQQKAVATPVIKEPTKKKVEPKRNYIAQVSNTDNQLVQTNDRPGSDTEPDQVATVESDVNEVIDEPQPNDQIANNSNSSGQNRREADNGPGSSGTPNMLPNIAGVYFGEIPYFKLCGNSGMEVNNDLAIISFKVQYYIGRESIEREIKGNRIPSDLCEDISRNSMGNTVFFTDIRAEHRVSGRTTHLNSMHLIPVK